MNGKLSLNRNQTNLSITRINIRVRFEFKTTYVSVSIFESGGSQDDGHTMDGHSWATKKKKRRERKKKVRHSTFKVSNAKSVAGGHRAPPHQYSSMSNGRCGGVHWLGQRKKKNLDKENDGFRLGSNERSAFDHIHST